MKILNYKYIFIVLASLGLLFTLTVNNDSRSKYERFIIKDLKSLNAKFKSAEGAQVQMDKPEMAAIQDYYATMDPSLKRVPAERLKKAMIETQKLKNNKSKTFDDYQWTEVPSNMGGRVRSLMIDPNDTDHKKVWAGSVTGGLWYNNDIYNDNSEWVPISDVWENLSISSLVYDPNNTQVFYAGTGEPQTAVTIYRESSTRGVGIWKTEDAGETWTLLTSTTDFPYISDMIIRDEDGTSVIYAGVVSGTYKGEDHTPTPSDGLYRSADGGNTWTQVLPNITGTTTPYSPSDIELAASDRIFVGTYRNIDGVGGATILYSDDGLNWNIYSDYVDIIESSSGGVRVDDNIPGRVMLASAPSNPNTTYAIIAAGAFTDENWIYYRAKHLIKTTDNGVSWIEKTVPNGNPYDNLFATLAWHALTIKVDPNDANTVYAGGLNIQKSKDGGETWELKTFWYSIPDYPYLHADQHSITFKPNNSDTIFFTNDGGVFASYDSTHTIIERNNSLNNLQFYTCDLIPDSGEVILVGGLQDNGTVLYNGTPFNSSTSSVSGGDGAFCFFDDNFLISTVYNNRVYVHQKTYESYTFKDSRNFASGTFISPMDYDAANNTLYANATDEIGFRPDQLLRIILNSTSIRSYSFINVGTNSTVYFSNVKHSKFSKSDNTVLYLGTLSGELFKVQNAQSTPSSTNIGSDNFPTGNISSIAEGKDENELLVTFSNYGVSSVWYTADGGTSWIEKESNLPDMPVRWGLFDPEDTARVILATEVGLWGTENIYAETVSWEPINNGMPNVRIDMLQLKPSDNMILAATHGRGLFYCDLEGESTIDDPTSINDIFETEIATTIYPNPTQGEINIEFKDQVSGSIEILVFNETGAQLKSIKSSSSDFINFNISELKNGTYFIKIINNNKSTSQKVILRK